MWVPETSLFSLSGSSNLCALSRPSQARLEAALLSSRRDHPLSPCHLIVASLSTSFDTGPQFYAGSSQQEAEAGVAPSLSCWIHHDRRGVTELQGVSHLLIVSRVHRTVKYWGGGRSVFAAPSRLFKASGPGGE